MTVETAITLGITILLFLGTIGTMIFSLGKRDSRLDVIEKRQAEDRANNKEAHKDFYASKYLAEQANGNVSRLEEDMKEMKGDIKTILSRIPPRGEE